MPTVNNRGRLLGLGLRLELRRAIEAPADPSAYVVEDLGCGNDMKAELLLN